MKNKPLYSQPTHILGTTFQSLATMSDIVLYLYFWLYYKVSFYSAEIVLFVLNRYGLMSLNKQFIIKTCFTCNILIWTRNVQNSLSQNDHSWYINSECIKENTKIWIWAELYKVAIIIRILHSYFLSDQVSKALNKRQKLSCTPQKRIMHAHALSLFCCISQFICPFSHTLVSSFIHVRNSSLLLHYQKSI